MAGTTTSSGLNNMLTDTQQVQTTLPTWMDTAQQNVISQAGTAQGAAPAFGQTAAQGAVNTLQPGATNPFTQAQGSLNTIASGAAMQGQARKNIVWAYASEPYLWHQSIYKQVVAKCRYHN